MYKKYIPKRIEDNIKEYFVKLFKDRITIVIGKKNFSCFLESFSEKLFKNTKIRSVDMQKINCGFEELTKKK